MNIPKKFISAKLEWFAIFLITVSLLFFCNPQDANALNDLNISDSNNFRFAVIGDRQGQERKGVFETAIQKLNILNPDFVVSVGDSIEGYTEDANVIIKQWNEFDAIVKKLNMPLLKGVGNHDMTNQTLARIYNQRYGQSYFHFVYKNILFLFISTEDPVSKEPEQTKNKFDRIKAGTYTESPGDTELALLKKKLQADNYADANIIRQYEQKSRNFRCTQITQQQVKYFKKVLKHNKNVLWTFVIMHKHAYQETNPPANWLKIEKMLSDRPYTVLSGHEHRCQYMQRNDSDYIGLGTVGGGHKYPPQAKDGIYDNILLITMKNGHPVIANILIDGVFDKTDVQKAKVFLMQN